VNPTTIPSQQEKKERRKTHTYNTQLNKAKNNNHYIVKVFNLE